MEEPVGPQLFELGRFCDSSGIVGIDTVPNDLDRHVDPRVPQDFLHEVGHDADTVEVPVEVVDHRLRYSTLFPAEVLAGEAPGRVNHPGRPHLTDHDVGVGHCTRTSEEQRCVRMQFKVPIAGSVVPGTFCGVDGDRAIRSTVQGARQAPVHDGEAVAGLERALELDLEWLRPTRGSSDHAGEKTLDVECLDVDGPERLDAPTTCSAVQDPF